MKVQDLKIGQIVYHRDVYDHGEALKIVGIKETELELEGDFSGGTHNVTQRQWLPLKGTSLIYHHKLKRDCRDHAITVEELAKPITDREQSNELKTMFDLQRMVMLLTTEVELNPEF